LPKSILESSTEMSAFLHVQINGILIYPVSANRGKYESISWFNYGVKVIVIVVDRPADILPDGVYWIWKKS
jgi:hypothetical protein